MGNLVSKRFKYTTISGMMKSDNDANQTVANSWKEAKNKNTIVMVKQVFDFKIMLEIYGQKFSCVLDTGSQHNAMPKYIVDELNLDSIVDKTMNLRFSALSGQGISYGIIPYLDINLIGNNCPTGFVVIDKAGIRDILLGTSFMRYYKVILDFEKNKIFINESEIPIKIIERKCFWI